MKALTSVSIIADHLTHNYQLFRSLRAEQEIFPAIKSNAYGHGLELVTEILQKMQPPIVAVHHAGEAERIWTVAPKQRVLVMGEHRVERILKFAEKPVEWMVSSLEILKDLEKRLSSQKNPPSPLCQRGEVNVHLFFDTGMHREGILPEEKEQVLGIVQACPHLKLQGLCSHLASADEVDPTSWRAQEKIFLEIVDFVEQQRGLPRWIHLGNSAGSAKLTDPRINAARVGIGFYGYNPLLPEDSAFPKLRNLKPALRLTSHIAQIRTLEPGETISYNDTFTVTETMRVGLIPVGYHEALDRKLSNTGFVQIRNQKMPILGRVCMNYTIIALPSNAKVEDEVIVYTENQEDLNSVESVAKMTGTIPYEVCTRISEEVEKDIIGQ